MKKNNKIGIIMIILFLGLFNTNYAQNIEYISNEKNAVKVKEVSNNGLVLSISVGNYKKTATTIEGQTYYLIENELGTPILDKGFPDIPKISRDIAIPNYSGVQVDVIREEYVDYDMLIAPSKGILLRTIDPNDVPYQFAPSIYNNEGFVPMERYELGEPYLLHSQRGVTINLYPFAYNPARRTLRIYTSIDVRISFSGYNSFNSSTMERMSNRFFDVIHENHFLNFRHINPTRSNYGKEKMLVICPDVFMDDMQPFIAHKNSIGLSTEIVALSNIGSTATDIKNFLQMKYNEDNMLTFVLLVGDFSFVPSFIVQRGASDPRYTLLNGNDIYPDIIIGRFSVETPQQVRELVNKTIAYETLGKNQLPWFKMGIGIASNDGNGSGDDNQYDWEHLREIRQNLINCKYADIAELYDGSQGGSDDNGNPNVNMVTDLINKGVSIINYTGHGNLTSWTTSGFSNDNIRLLQNDNKLPFIFSVACLNGNFSNATCFAEMWLRATNGEQPTGAIGFYGSSIEQPWQPPMEAQDKFNELLCSEQFSTFGELCFNGACSMLSKYPESNSTFLTWNYF